MREVIELICERVNTIEKNYPEDEKEHCHCHEDLKILAVYPAWLDHYKITYQRVAQRGVNTWCRLLIQRTSQETWHSTAGLSPYLSQIQIILSLAAMPSINFCDIAMGDAFSKTAC